MATRRGTSRQTWVAIRAMLVLTLVLGVLYPLVITGIGQLAAAGPGQRLARARRRRGRRLEPHRPVVHRRRRQRAARVVPVAASAAGDGYDAARRAAATYGPENDDLIAAIGDRQAAIAKADGVALAEIPADAVTASGSGLDPHISPAYALLQVERVAEARGLPVAEVREAGRVYDSGTRPRLPRRADGQRAAAEHRARRDGVG